MGSQVALVGRMLRAWRERRRLSQLDLALDAGVSQKHVSFVESGRAAPSRDMVLTLARALDVPLRERNALLNAAGFAPVFRDRGLDDPALAPALASLDRLLAAHEPWPALTVDRHWTLVAANAAVAPLLAGVDPQLTAPPVNVMRLSLHPRGLAPLIVNLAEWRAHLLERLRRQMAATGDPAIAGLLAECEAYPGRSPSGAEPGLQDVVAVPLRLRTHAGVLSFLSTVTVFGTAVDVTLSELSLEAFYPADPGTARALEAAGDAGTAAPRGLRPAVDAAGTPQ
jgi:transcriptional regulator with XRE-family HTH domain